MTNAPRPIRSFVAGYVAGGGFRVEEGDGRQILSAGADAVWWDLEDYTHPRNMEKTRQLLGEIVESLSSEGHAVLVRVHGGTEPHEVVADLAGVFRPGLYGVLLPKTEVGHVTTLSQLLDHLEEESGATPGQTKLFPLIESASGVRDAHLIAQESPRIAYMGWCVSRIGDPARSIGFNWTADGAETLYMRSQVLIAARAAKVPFPIGGGHDSGHPDGLEHLRTFANAEKNIGLLGMACGPDPESIAIVNEVFTPSADEVSAWQELVAAEEEADRQGTVSAPSSAKWARQRLKHAAAIEAMVQAKPPAAR